MEQEKLNLKNPFDIFDRPNCYDGHQYAIDVVLGEINANIWVKAACRRYLRDYWRAIEDENCPFFFKEKSAERYLRLVQKFHHPVGEWKTKEILYEPWQKFIFLNLKGFYSKETTFIRFRTAMIDIGRGNSKSTMASQAALYEVSLSEVLNGNRVYCAATSRDQAREVLDGARIMASKNPEFCKKRGVRVLAHEIKHLKSNSFVRAISSQTHSLDGKIGSLVITDELHAMRRETFEVLDSGQSKRKDSLLLSITTAGYSNDGIGYTQRAYAKKVALGEVEDDTFFALIYCLDKDDDWMDEANWIKANPNFGVSVDPDNFRAKAKKAKENPVDAPNFRLKHLNEYLDSMNPYFDTVRLKELYADILLEMFKGKACYVGLDLATKTDIVSICYLFPEKRKMPVEVQKVVDGVSQMVVEMQDVDYYTLFWKNFIPEVKLQEVKNRKYLEYIEQGDLVAMKGEVIAFETIESILEADAKIFKFQKVLFDPWNAVQLSQNLTKKKLPMVEIKMNTLNLSEPMKKIKEVMSYRGLQHSGKNLIVWTFGNVVAKHDANENVYPRKDHEDLKIDPPVAAIMAVAGAINEEDLPPPPSVYVTRGLRVIN